MDSDACAHMHTQCTLKEESDLKGTSIRAAGFRGRFGAAVVAVKRKKKRVEGKIGDIVLQPHDQLVLDTGESPGVPSAVLLWVCLKGGLCDGHVLGGHAHALIVPGTASLC